MTSKSRTERQGLKSVPQTLQELSWTNLSKQRNIADPTLICNCDSTPTSPRLAKDEEYANAVLNKWRADILSENDAQVVDTIGAPLIYNRKSDGSKLNGYLVMRSNMLGLVDTIQGEKVPAVLLFHTGAGPQDISLRWKADMLARDPIWGPSGCIVLIADLVSDDTGWTWDDRSKYDLVRKELLAATKKEGDKHAHRWKLRETIDAALDALTSIDKVDSERICAMGFCLGGHPVIELGRMNRPGVRSLITFHGVFDGTAVNSEFEAESNIESPEKRVLICNGASDPFVSDSDLEASRKTFEYNGWKVEILNLEGVKHGFTNPAQDCNPSESFAYNDDAAKISWSSTIDLLKEVMFDKK